MCSQASCKFITVQCIFGRIHRELQYTGYLIGCCTISDLVGKGEIILGEA